MQNWSFLTSMLQPSHASLNLVNVFLSEIVWKASSSKSTMTSRGTVGMAA